MGTKAKKQQTPGPISNQLVGSCLEKQPKLTKKQAVIETLRMAKGEIEILSRDNRNMRLRLSGFEDAMKLLNARDYGACTGLREDPIFAIDRQIEAIEKSK